jgi:GTP-binding protein
MLSMEGERKDHWAIPISVYYLRNQLLTATAEAIMAHRLQNIKFIKEHHNLDWSYSDLAFMENGKSIPHSIDKLQDRGKFCGAWEDIFTEGHYWENSPRWHGSNITKMSKAMYVLI